VANSSTGSETPLLVEAQQVTSECAGSEIYPGVEVQQVANSSTGSETPLLVEAQQVTSESAGSEIYPGVEVQHVANSSTGSETPLLVEAQQVTSESAGSEIYPGVEVQQVANSSTGSETPLLVEAQQESNPSADPRAINSIEIQQVCNLCTGFPIPLNSVAAWSSHSHQQSNHFQAQYHNREWAQASTQYGAPRYQYPRRRRMTRHAPTFRGSHNSMYIEQAAKHINNLMEQVGDLKNQLQIKTVDLQKEREQRITIQVECTAYLEKIQELEETLEHERHIKVECEPNEEDQERSIVSDTERTSKLQHIPKATVDVNILNEVNFLKKQAETHNLHCEKLAETLVEEQKLRLQCEDQLKNYRELGTKFREQEQKIKSLQSHIVNLTLELKLASKDNDHEVSSQNNSSNQAEVSTPTQISTPSVVSTPSQVSRPSEVSIQIQEPTLSGHHANRHFQTGSGPHQCRRQHSIIGIHANPGPQSNTAGLNANRGVPSYRGPQGNHGLHTNAGLHTNPGHYPISGLYKNQDLSRNPGSYPNPGLYANPGPHSNPGSYANPGPYANPGIYKDPGHYTNPGPYRNQGLSGNPGFYPYPGPCPNPNPGLFTNVGHHPNAGFHANRLPPYRAP
ncbi:hypothetical protein GOODEAATRI_029086, partial [Goodea atripinnis]